MVWETWVQFQVDRFGFFVWWHINLRGLVNGKAILLEEQSWYYLIHSWEDRWGGHAIPQEYLSECVLARLEFELAYYDLPRGQPQSQVESKEKKDGTWYIFALYSVL